jgi:Fur family ferric uptake transcriptional regulator
MVREHLPRISLGTIYRNLELLVNSGEILCLHHSGAQKRFDGNASPHRHIHCSRCGKIGDVFTSMPLPMPHPADAPGFFIQSVEIEFIGLCDACGTKRPEPLRT